MYCNKLSPSPIQWLPFKFLSGGGGGHKSTAAFNETAHNLCIINGHYDVEMIVLLLKTGHCGVHYKKKS